MGKNIQKKTNSKNQSKPVNNEENAEQTKLKSHQLHASDALASSFGENLSILPRQDKSRSPAAGQHTKSSNPNVHTNGHHQRTSSNIDADGYDIPVGNPEEWDCNQVYSFVKQIAGSPVAITFKVQEVDGSALALIKDDHLVNTMQLKLGPALKILHKFNEIRAKFK